MVKTQKNMILKTPSKHYSLKELVQIVKVPENIHSHEYEHSLEILRWVGLKCQKSETKAWSETGVSGGEGVSNQKNLPWIGYGYFLE